MYHRLRDQFLENRVKIKRDKLKARGTHTPTQAWPVPHACAQPYHPGGGSLFPALRYALPRFLPFCFRLRAFSIQRARLSRSLEQARAVAAMDSCFALIGVHQRGIAVGPLRMTMKCKLNDNKIKTILLDFYLHIYININFHGKPLKFTTLAFIVIDLFVPKYGL